MPIPAPRRPTRRIQVGPVPVGDGAPVSVQTMTKTDTRDVAATLAQIREVRTLGCDLVRVAVPDAEAARALRRICGEAGLPVIADIHFDYRLALAALESGAAGLRLNPGNIGRAEHVARVVRAARERQAPIRVGVNSGSLSPAIRRRYGGPTAEALVESALHHVRLIEDCGYQAIKISVKATDVPRTVEAYRLLAARTDYPLHLGVTEAGTLIPGTVRSCAALALLLADGIGDTLRVSLSDTPGREVRVGAELLRALGLRAPGPSVISCPACGRAEIDVIEMSRRVEAELDALYREAPDRPRPVVAVMGCVVNGPGEAREADIAVAGGQGRAALYVGGRRVRTVAEAEAVPALLAAVREWQKHA